MAKFGKRNVSFPLNVPILDAPRRALRKLLQRAGKQNVSNFSNLAVTENSQMHDAILRAERQKTLGFHYLEQRKLTFI
ncbi:MAG: hypothetical protein NWE83_06525 [Candidatus Bathyarchaeota archaeon]|nr:hypothetical protein [Candidatus Bathyarchaeota archaeon]